MHEERLFLTPLIHSQRKNETLIDEIDRGHRPNYEQGQGVDVNDRESNQASQRNWVAQNDANAPNQIGDEG